MSDETHKHDKGRYDFLLADALARGKGLNLDGSPRRAAMAAPAPASDATADVKRLADEYTQAWTDGDTNCFDEISNVIASAILADRGTRPASAPASDDAAVEAAAKAIHDHWQNAPGPHARSWDQCVAKLPRAAMDFRAKARAALIAATRAAPAPASDAAVLTDEPVAHLTGVGGVTLRWHILNWIEPARSEGLATPGLYAAPASDAAVKALEAEVEQLRNALMPLVGPAEAFGHRPDAFVVFGSGGQHITAGDLKRIRAALRIRSEGRP